MRSIWTAILAVGILGPPALHAQFIGFTAPQTNQQNLATGVACTGAAQIFLINNRGQTQHYLSITALGTTQVSAIIQGVDATGNIYLISDVLQTAPNVTGVVYGSGYFPKIQASVTCSPSGGAGTFTLNYSGAWGTFNNSVGNYQISQIDKSNFSGVPGNANFSNNVFLTPFGNSAGTLYFLYVGGSAGGGSLRVQCQPTSIGTTTPVFTATLANTSSLQSFPVPNLPCILATVTYLNSGAAGTVFSEYVFAVPGLQPGNGAVTHIANATATSAKAFPGFLHTLTINTGQIGTVSIFDLDSTACTGTPATNTIAVITATAATTQTYTYDINAVNGICVKASVGAMDITVSTQ